MNKSLWEQEMRKDIWVRLQKPETNLVVFHVCAHKASTAPGNQGEDALAKIGALATDPSVGTTEWVHRKSGHHSVQVGWCTAKEAELALKYSDLVNVFIEWSFHVPHKPTGIWVGGIGKMLSLNNRQGIDWKTYFD